MNGFTFRKVLILIDEEFAAALQKLLAG